MKERGKTNETSEKKGKLYNWKKNRERMKIKKMEFKEKKEKGKRVKERDINKQMGAHKENNLGT